MPSVTREWARQRATKTWRWPVTALALFLPELAFGAWAYWNFSYISGCWDVMREMELGAFQLPMGQTLSLGMPLWLALGIVCYNLALGLLLGFWRLERRYLRLLETPTPAPRARGVAGVGTADAKGKANLDTSPHKEP
jgi:hypothetical protein